MKDVYERFGGFDDHLNDICHFFLLKTDVQRSQV